MENSSSKERLILSSIDLFSRKWFGTVSVAEICRNAGLSNGLFYKYFKDKEAIFKEILDLVIAKISSAVAQVAGESALERLTSFIDIIYSFSQENTALVKVFREGQYRYFEYEKRLKTVYERALFFIFKAEPDIADYLFGLGGLRFASIRAAFHQIPVDLKRLLAILKNGIFHGLPIDEKKVFSTSITPLPLQIMPDGRERLLIEGKTLFGEKGYFDTNIHEITDKAGLSTGAFYTYFDSKESFYSELIHRVGREVRHFITINLPPGLNSLERELRGLWLFIVYLSIDRTCYGIVREAEFVLPAEVKIYYDAFAEGYRKHQDPGIAALDPTSIEFLLGVAHYLGIEVIFDESPANARNVILQLGSYYQTGFSGKFEL